METTSNQTLAPSPSAIVKLYRQSVKNVPLLKYSWILIATICILSLTAYFKQNNSDVFFYAIGVIIISFLGFVFSYLLRSKDWFISVLLKIIMSSIALTLCTAILGFGSFIVFDKPKFYNQWFPKNQSEVLSMNTNSNSNTVGIDTASISSSQDSIKTLQADSALKTGDKPQVRDEDKQIGGGKKPEIQQDTSVSEPKPVQNPQLILENKPPLTEDVSIDKEDSKNVKANVVFQYSNGKIIMKAKAKKDSSKTYIFHLELELKSDVGNRLYRKDTQNHEVKAYERSFSELLYPRVKQKEQFIEIEEEIDTGLSIEDRLKVKKLDVNIVAE